MASSQNQSTNGGQAEASRPQQHSTPTTIEFPYDTILRVDVGNGEHVPIPITRERPLTRERIYQALVAAGHQERAAEHVERVWTEMTEPCEPFSDDEET
jgi:hypothetical protein